MIKNYANAILRTVASVSILLAVGTATAATTVNLKVQRATATMPDGSSVPMWQFCGAAVSNADTTPSAGSTSGGVCPTLAPGAWTPGPTITVPVGDTLTINLTNALNVPTSIVVLGQLGGGLGQGTRMPSPAHPAQNFSTFVGNAPAGPFTPPAQADRVKSFGSEVSAGNTTPVALTWNNLKPGTYIYETGTLPSLQVPMGLYGLLIVTQAPVPANALASTPFAPGIAYASVNYDSDAALLFSEIDPVQNAQVDAAARFGASMEANLRFNDPSCVAAGLNGANACYPAAVNYSPKYFLINGHAFDKTQPQNSALAVPATDSTGKVLLRLANAGSLTHIPSFIGLSMALAAEDGNVLPGNPRVQNEVLLTAGKVYDVLVSPSGTVAAGYTPGAVPFFDRRLNTTSANQVDGGMQGFLQIAGGALPSAVVPTAVDDTFQVPLNTAINGNVKFNDIAVAAVALGTGPTNGVLTALNPDGTLFTLQMPTSRGRTPLPIAATAEPPVAQVDRLSFRHPA